MKRLAIGTGLAVLLISASEATATPINITSLQGVAISDIGGDVLGPNTPSTAPGPFADTVSANLADVEVSANQTSDIQSSGLFTGTGDASVGFQVLEDEQVNALSIYQVDFEITSAHSFILSGALAALVEGGEGLGSFTLAGPTPLSFEALNSGTVPLAATGVLAPGNYTLMVLAQMSPGQFDPGSFMSGAAAFDFNFQIEEAINTPEPATLALLALGLGALRFRARRREK